MTQIDPNWRKLGGIVSQDANAFTPYLVNLSELSEEVLKTKFDIFMTGKNVSSQKSCFQMRWSCSRECQHLVFRPLLRDILSKYEINDKSPEIQLQKSELHRNGQQFGINKSFKHFSIIKKELILIDGSNGVHQPDLKCCKIAGNFG